MNCRACANTSTSLHPHTYSHIHLNTALTSFKPKQRMKKGLHCEYIGALRYVCKSVSTSSSLNRQRCR